MIKMRFALKVNLAFVPVCASWRKTLMKHAGGVGWGGRAQPMLCTSAPSAGAWGQPWGTLERTRSGAVPLP